LFVSSEDDEIRKLKEVATNTINPSVKVRTIDALAAYGAKAIPAITEVVKDTIQEQVRLHGLDTIKKIKEGSRGR
jgi:hypothetical protein